VRLISVVIPSYNHAQYVRKAIRSVLEQDYAALELIVIDDGSRDGSPDIIREALADARGRRVVFLEQANAGAHAAIMRGLSLARGDVLTILNSDDHYEKGRFSAVMRSAPSSGDFIAFTKLHFIDENDQPMAADSGIQAWYDRALSDAAQCPTVGYGLLRNNFSVTSGNLVFTASLYSQVGGFGDYKMCHDWDFLMRATHRVEPIYIQQDLMAYRVHPTNTLNSTQHLLLAEGVPAINTFVKLGMAEAPPNPLAPGWAHWPFYFDHFIDTCASWFSSEPIRGFLDVTMPRRAWANVSSWTDARRLGLSDCGYLSDAQIPTIAREAFAFQREAALRKPATTAEPQPVVPVFLEPAAATAGPGHSETPALVQGELGALVRAMGLIPRLFRKPPGRRL
jgi:glycosyltransferase involved in cell wall biosynthesis